MIAWSQCPRSRIENAGFRLAKNDFARVTKASGGSFDSTAKFNATLQTGKFKVELMNTVSWHWTISESGIHLELSHQYSTRLRSASLSSSDSLIECFILHLLYYNAFSLAQPGYQKYC
jgi:hypothetical protein